MTEQFQGNINPRKFYKPMQIVQNGWILNTAGNRGRGSYNFVLKLINSGQIKGRNIGIGKVPHFQVRGSEILRFIGN